MKRLLLMVLVVLIASIFTCKITYAGKTLDESTANSLLKSKIHNSYFFIPEGQVRLDESGKARNRGLGPDLQIFSGVFLGIDNFTGFLNHYKEQGLIEYNLIYSTPSSMKMKRVRKKGESGVDGAEIAIKEEIKKYPHVFLHNKSNFPVKYKYGGDPSVFAFIIGERKINKIVAIEKKEDNYIVKFLFTETLSGLGKRSDNKEYKYKGISEIYYDEFTEKYIFKSIKWSSLEGPLSEEWLDMSWSEEVGGKAVARFGDK